MLQAPASWEARPTLFALVPEPVLESSKTHVQGGGCSSPCFSAQTRKYHHLNSFLLWSILLRPPVCAWASYQCRHAPRCCLPIWVEIYLHLVPSSRSTPELEPHLCLCCPPRSFLVHGTEATRFTCKCNPWTEEPGRLQSIGS